MGGRVRVHTAGNSARFTYDGQRHPFLPSTTALGTVRIDRGIGLVSLGEREAAVVDLLRGPRRAPGPCRRCTRSFGALLGRLRRRSLAAGRLDGELRRVAGDADRQ